MEAVMLCHDAIDRCSRLYRRMAGRQEPAEAGDRGHIPETGREREGGRFGERRERRREGREWPAALIQWGWVGGKCFSMSHVKPIPKQPHSAFVPIVRLNVGALPQGEQAGQE